MFLFLLSFGCVCLFCVSSFWAHVEVVCVDAPFFESGSCWLPLGSRRVTLLRVPFPFSIARDMFTTTGCASEACESHRHSNTVKSLLLRSLSRTSVVLLLSLHRWPRLIFGQRASPRESGGPSLRSLRSRRIVKGRAIACVVSWPFSLQILTSILVL